WPLANVPITRRNVRFRPKADISNPSECSKSDSAENQRPNAIALKSLASVAQRAQSGSTTKVIFMGYGSNKLGGSMSRAPRTAQVHDDAIIAFLLFCLEIYQAEQERKRKLH